MKRNLLRFGLSLIALFVMVVANAQTYQNEEASVSWPFNDANYATQYTKSPENGFSLVSVNTGDLKYSQKTSQTTKDKDGNKMVMAGFGPVGTTKAVEWTVKPSKGLTFTPTSISTYVNRFGTDAENGVTVTAKLSDGTSVDLGNFTALRENKTTESDKYSKNENLTNHIVIQLTADQQAKLTSAEGFTLSCTVGVGATKQQGFADVHINGLLNGTIQQVEQYTLSAVVSTVGAGTVKVSPAGTVFDAETPITVTATKNFGYKFVNWTDANNKVVSTDEEYTFSISANTALKANFEKINTYALDYKVEGGAKDYMVTLSPAPEMVDGKKMYEEGTEVTLTATGNDIIDFNNWSNGETTAEIKTTMNEDQAFTATFSAKDYIVAWDFYQEGKEGRTADFAAADNDAVQLVLRDAEGNSYGWLDKSNTAGGYEGKNAAVNWTKTTTKALGETYWQTKFNATAFTDIKVKSSMLYNYNAYETYNVEYSLDGEKWTKVGAITMPGAKAWTAGEFTLPAEANNQAAVFVRWIADKTSSVKGTTGTNDGIALAQIYITGTAKLFDDGTAPVLQSQVPAAGATNASANGKIVLTFDEKVKLTESAKATLNGQELTGTVSGKTITFAYKGLSYATEYTFALAAGSVADLTDNAIQSDITFSFTTKEKPAVTKALYDFIVPTDGSFTDALAAAAKRADISKRFRIFIKQGDYKIPANPNSMVTGIDGKQYPSATTYMNTPNVSIIGESNENTSITNTVPAVECDNGFGMANVLEGIGKGDVLSLESGAVNTYFQDIKMYSSMGDGKGRDIVLNDKSNKTICKNVNLWAYQDTYVSNNQRGRFYFEGGILRGNTDYLCGKGDVYYNNVDLLMCGTGYLAVPSQPTKYGYIFKDCTIKDGSTAGINGKYKLGRPWGKGTPIALFIDTKMEVIPTAAGWDEMSGGYPKRFAEYNSTTVTGTAVDLSGRKQVYDAYDAKDGDNYTDRRNETAESPVLTAEEAAFYTLETVMGGDDDWDPTAATEQASAPTNVKIAGNNLTWDNSNYALLWAVCKDGKVVDFTVEPTYAVDDASATWSVRAANEMGGLGEATVASTSTGIENIATSSDVLSTKIYSADGVQVSKLQRGINIVVKTMTDGSKKTSKVVLK
ncbi:pectin esterase [Prevotella copri]|uniref:Pectin esterase n=1 Tax=Segatella copri TaxID=165179 RepID=A0A6A7WE43_9BACT|nr:Ig-like domain-containing protein [Segatella copri]MQP12598.1 pectin esterase [Segatella copri]